MESSSTEKKLPIWKERLVIALQVTAYSLEFAAFFVLNWRLAYVNYDPYRSRDPPTNNATVTAGNYSAVVACYNDLKSPGASYDCWNCYWVPTVFAFLRLAFNMTITLYEGRLFLGVKAPATTETSEASEESGFCSFCSSFGTLCVSLLVLATATSKMAIWLLLEKDSYVLKCLALIATPGAESLDGLIPKEGFGSFTDKNVDGLQLAPDEWIGMLIAISLSVMLPFEAGINVVQENWEYSEAAIERFSNLADSIEIFHHLDQVKVVKDIHLVRAIMAFGFLSMVANTLKVAFVDNKSLEGKKTEYIALIGVPVITTIPLLILRLYFIIGLNIISEVSIVFVMKSTLSLMSDLVKIYQKIKGDPAEEVAADDSQKYRAKSASSTSLGQTPGASASTTIDLPGGEEDSKDL